MNLFPDFKRKRLRTSGAQINLVVICVLASLGSAGIPQGGLAILPLVLASAGLSDDVIGQAYPLILTVDWIVARVRSGVNVLGDMTVAVQLEAAGGSREQVVRSTE